MKADIDDDGHLTTHELIALYQELTDRLDVEREDDYEVGLSDVERTPSFGPKSHPM